MYPVHQIPINEMGNSVVTPTNERKENKRRKKCNHLKLKKMIKKVIASKYSQCF